MHRGSADKVLNHSETPVAFTIHLVVDCCKAIRSVVGIKSATIITCRKGICTADVVPCIRDNGGRNVGGELHEASSNFTISIGQSDYHILGNVEHDTRSRVARTFIEDIIAVVGLGHSFRHLGGKIRLQVSKREEAKSLGGTENETSGVGSKSHNDSTISCFRFGCVFVGNEFQLDGESLTDLRDKR